MTTVARYGNTGRALALQLAAEYPFRAPGTPEEAAVADWIVAELGKHSFQAEKVPFSYTAPDGSAKQSCNVVLRVKGKGFKAVPYDDGDPMRDSLEMQAPAELNGRSLIIGAHYDSAFSRASAAAYDAERTAPTDENGNLLPAQQTLPPMTENNGIDDNAASVATLLTLATLLKGEPPAYDVTLVFFGAGHDNFAGANAFAGSLTPEQLPLIDAMINLDSIYAGDKVYAHAGLNSVRAGNEKNYAMRRKLYGCTDVYYDNLLLTRNGFALYTNQSGCMKELDGVGQVIFREWTDHTSDHLPFDHLGIPIVYFESADYDIEDCSLAVKQSNDPYFSPVDGMIRGSSYDNSGRLIRYFVPEGQLKDAEVFGKEDEALPAEETVSDYRKTADRLEIRINNIAFILREICQKGPPGTEPR